jgi:hypothetical protein
MRLMCPSKIPIFISVGTPHNPTQELYQEKLIKYLASHGVKGETLGRSYWSINKPLIPIQKKMCNVYGACILGMTRFHSINGIYKEGSPDQKVVSDQLFSSVWCQIEAAMAYQMDLPLLILKEESLQEEGMFDPGIHEWMIVRIHPTDPDEITRNPIKGFIDSWIEEVRKKYYKSI